MTSAEAQILVTPGAVLKERNGVIRGGDFSPPQRAEHSGLRRRPTVKMGCDLSELTHSRRHGKIGPVSKLLVHYARLEP